MTKSTNQNKWLLYSILGRKDIAIKIRAYKHFALFWHSAVKVVRQGSVMSILCSISAIKDRRAAKNNKKHYIWEQVNILAIHFTGRVSLWFFNPFLMYPLSLQQLGSDNTAYLGPIYNLIIFNILWSIVKKK